MCKSTQINTDQQRQGMLSLWLQSIQNIQNPAAALQFTSWRWSCISYPALEIAELHSLHTKKMFAYVCIVQLTLSCQGCYFVRATAIDSEIQRGIWEPLALLGSMFYVQCSLNYSITRLMLSFAAESTELKLKWGLAVGLHHVLEARHIWRLPAWTIIKRLIGQFVVTQTHCSHCRTYLSLCFPVSFCVLSHCFGVK